ncbi:MAG: type toxin-antitoxin system prevent-host-death family antitoxin [Sphingomonas bacterium]|uniref:type II toxin-antitoxin system Phd/YefM family antitoxin n=1 Tax=Sphingomonas bacterium TaxID=1895847 RepID=UPI00260163AE|nr:type II toxin-antitoxin system Phd/YefM family antitoxin [Sphingomonas bacterium]MDB5706399.1 type toxin-antitoxin system prevent-host-death family antitoxin [Sphingomonas bacterium]
MNAIVNIHEAKTHFSKLIERAHSGEEIVVAKAGKPYARLVPLEVEPKPDRKPGGLKILGDIPDSVWFDPLPDDELDAWEGKYSNIV